MRGVPSYFNMLGTEGMMHFFLKQWCESLDTLFSVFGMNEIFTWTCKTPGRHRCSGGLRIGLATC